MTPAPIAVALDAPSLAVACEWAQQTAPYVECLKVGLQAYLRDGAPGVARIRAAAGDSSPALFLDLKLHDIPNTVAGAANSVAEIAPDFLTVHASGGQAMISAAVGALPNTRITAVTLLTSLSEQDLADIGLVGSPIEVVVRLAKLSVDAGAKAIVCSPQEVSAVRAAVPTDIILITPGVRPANSESSDQRRVATPEQALKDGADLLVVGRPITAASDPGAAAQELASQLHLSR